MDDIFRDEVFYLDSACLNLKSKDALKRIISRRGGQVSFSLNKKVTNHLYNCHHGYYKIVTMVNIDVTMVVMIVAMMIVTMMIVTMMNVTMKITPTVTPLFIQISCVLSDDVEKFSVTSRGLTCKTLHIPVVTSQFLIDSDTAGVKQVVCLSRKYFVS